MAKIKKPSNFLNFLDSQKKITEMAFFRTRKFQVNPKQPLYKAQLLRSTHTNLTHTQHNTQTLQSLKLKINLSP